MLTPHKFLIGDNVQVTDHHTNLGIPIDTPYTITGEDGDYYLARKRSFKDSRIHRLPKYYPHIVKG